MLCLQLGACPGVVIYEYDYFHSVCFQFLYLFSWYETFCANRLRRKRFEVIVVCSITDNKP